MKDVIRGDLLEVEVDLEAESLAWPDNEWFGLFAVTATSRPTSRSRAVTQRIEDAQKLLDSLD